jgi:DNA mismatch repair protein MutL
VNNAFEELLPSSSYPTYFIYFEINPNAIDINIHPTKTEVKFLDEKNIYAILRSSVKQSLGKFNLTPTIDFDVEQSLVIPLQNKNEYVTQPKIKVNPDYNPFENRRLDSTHSASNKKNWDKLYTTTNISDSTKQPNENVIIESDAEQQTIQIESEHNTTHSSNNIFQLHNKYILSNIKSGLMIIDQQNAHERILYERFMDLLDKKQNCSQQLLFPQTVEFSTSDSELIKELKTDIELLGFDINQLGKNTFAINGIPTDIKDENVKDVLEKILENYKKNQIDLKLDRKTNLAESMAKNISVKSGKSLKFEEMNALIDELFACQMPYVSPAGKPTFHIITVEEIEKKFK